MSANESFEEKVRQGRRESGAGRSSPCLDACQDVERVRVCVRARVRACAHVNSPFGQVSSLLILRAVGSRAYAPSARRNVVLER
jgi:hypothetical protein